MQRYRLFVLSNRGRRWGNATWKERQANTNNQRQPMRIVLKTDQEAEGESGEYSQKAKTTDNKKPRTVEDAE